MQDENGIGFRLRLLDMLEPWRSPIHCLHEIAYDNFKDIDLRLVLLSLRDMSFRPPQSGNTAFDCLNEWCGTGIAKHFAVYDLLRRLGLFPRMWMANYLMGLSLPSKDDSLAKIIRRQQIQDVHVFLTCDFGAGERIVDITFPARMHEEGFIVTKDWKRSHDCNLPCAVLEQREITADARGLWRVSMWTQLLNPGIKMRYRQQLIDHIIKIADEGDTHEARKRHIHRTYFQINNLTPPVLTNRRFG